MAAKAHRRREVSAKKSQLNIIEHGLPKISVPPWPVGVLMTCNICRCKWEIGKHDEVYVRHALSKHKSKIIETLCPNCGAWAKNRQRRNLED